MASQREAELFLAKLLPAVQLPLGLLHLGRICIPVELECHQHVLIRVRVPQTQVREGANRPEVIRAHIPNVDGARLSHCQGNYDHYILVDSNLDGLRRESFLPAACHTLWHVQIPRCHGFVAKPSVKSIR